MSEMIVSKEAIGPYGVTFEQRKKQLELEKKKEEEEREKQLKDAKKSPFKSFYQINKATAKHLTELIGTQPNACKILFFIFENMDNYNALTCSYKVFQERFDISKATVQRSIKYLKDNGFIYIYKSGTNNVYVANDNLVWNSYGTNKKYCKFPSNVILSLSEQEKTEGYKKERLNSVILDGKLINKETGEIITE